MLKRNLIANYLGNGWVALMLFAFVPVYIRYLGIEAYGLIGFFASFQALLGLLDLGLGAAVNRQMARMSGDHTQSNNLGHLLRTLETVYWAIAAIIAVIVIVTAPILATHWLQAKQMPLQQVTQGIVMLGLVFAARWPFALYSGVLLGLQQQIKYNVLRVLIETTRSAGAAFILWRVSPTLDAFLVWQLITVGMGSLLAGCSLANNNPHIAIPAMFQDLHIAYREA